MKPGKIIPIIIIVSIAGFILYSLQGSQSSESYLDGIRQYREDKNSQMVGEGAPFAGKAKEFTGLKYFDIDPAYRISASLEPVKDRKVVILSTNDGRENRYLEYAWADFAINDVKCRLLILEVMEDGPEKGSLFLAFADETSARETYGAGRYLDINKVPGSSSVLLDFNKAYNPYCAYSDNFSCPFPPKQNILGVPIRAGEKTYH
ncbi:MAG: DUF1684 domain-containing protein [Cyclobacteriaceae bacterium]|nr:DUF1684 domain-containing protein [Cyclobacteriaceae bacterium]MCB0500135.1 DUF1684 domain-containing protein [Cyclobacteriaceae bacterium]MCB9237137.1 DUF1684 domain-containing protein [Flammeovirgaceae bacterium]MCO5270846.1 DUF1684 domain-containing protein [Cyclobacteriaceae bacterium]MCW5901868.1 DUF1684 domain-containing protein [Cyclobacteriaceae bacterium]